MNQKYFDDRCGFTKQGVLNCTWKCYIVGNSV